MKIDHKCNKTVKYYPSRIYSKERRPQFKSDRNKRRGALSKNTLFYKCFLLFSLFAIFMQSGVLVVCYTAVFSVVTQRSSPLTAAENRTTFLSLCVCGLTNKPITYKKFDNT